LPKVPVENSILVGGGT